MLRGKDGRFHKYKHGHNSKLEGNPNWGGGRYQDSNGYILIRILNYHSPIKDGYVYEHRYVYEQNFNCCLLPWIDIDHINNIKNDNRIENLRAFSKSEHGRRHGIEYWNSRK